MRESVGPKSPCLFWPLDRSKSQKEEVSSLSSLFLLKLQNWQFVIKITSSLSLATQNFLSYSPCLNIRMCVAPSKSIAFNFFGLFLL